MSMTLNRRHLLLGGAALTALASCRRSAGADLDIAYTNARIWTGQADQFSNAIGTVGPRIAAIGADEVRARTGKKTQVVDLGGAFVIPGLVDCHTHFTRGSFLLSQPSLRDASTPAEYTRRIGEAAQALPPGQWLEGGNWDNDGWGGELPTRQWIDAVTPNTPVVVSRYDLHMIAVNSVALKLAGIDRNTPDVPGGVIVRDAKGEPTGIFKDAAKDLIFRAMPEHTNEQIDAAVTKGIANGLGKGVTQVHMPEPFDWIGHDCVRRLRARGETNMRFYSFNPLRDWEKTAALIKAEGHGDDWVRWGACKVVFDGSLGSRTAYFYEPYLDDPSTRGIIVTDPKDMLQWMTAADAAGLQVAAHAIGDEANDDVLDAMATVAKTNGARDRRFRIEHAQHLSVKAIPRFAEQGVIASIQPYHAVDDGRWAIKRIGPERLTRTYAFHSILATGAHVGMGSDWPVAPIDPLTGIKAAVVRETIDGKNPGGWYPEQRLTLTQALTGYTSGSAYAGFTEDRLGMLAPGFLADFVVLDRNLFEIDPETITDTKVLRTIVNGAQRYGTV